MVVSTGRAKTLPGTVHESHKSGRSILGDVEIVKIIVSGKTKNVFLQEDGNLQLIFKDDVTGRKGKIDPGANEVLGKISGKGNASLRLSVYFFNLLQRNGLSTHFIEANPGENSMIVKQARSFNLEVICREKAYGSFIRRYGRYIREGAPLPSLVEFTLKDDKRGDPLSRKTQLRLAAADQRRNHFLKQTTRHATALIKEDLAGKGMELIDIKLEFGDQGNRSSLLMKFPAIPCVLCKNRILSPKELCFLMLGN